MVFSEWCEITSLRDLSLRMFCPPPLTDHNPLMWGIHLLLQQINNVGAIDARAYEAEAAAASLVNHTCCRSLGRVVVEVA